MTPAVKSACKSAWEIPSRWSSPELREKTQIPLQASNKMPDFTKEALPPRKMVTRARELEAVMAERRAKGVIYSQSGWLTPIEQGSWQASVGAALRTQYTDVLSATQHIREGKVAFYLTSKVSSDKREFGNNSEGKPEAPTKKANDPLMVRVPSFLRPIAIAEGVVKWFLPTAYTSGAEGPKNLANF